MDDPQVHQPQGSGTIFDEIRRQMEEMLGGRRPMGPTVIPGAPAADARRAAANDHFGLAMVSLASYWLLPIMAAKRKQRQARAAAENQPPADNP